MELRVLQYFLAVAREGSISAAAEALHISQPTLSRQLKDLEEELGKTLLIRGNRKTTLTEDGLLLQKRAQELLTLAQKTEAELRQPSTHIGGDVWIGGGESEGMRLVAQAARSLKDDYPDIHIHLVSGNAIDILERLEKGLVDFGVGVVGSVDSEKYESVWLPAAHVAGLLMRKDSPLASREFITPEDLQGIPLITSRNEATRRRHAQWMGKGFDTLNVVATYNLIYNATFLVEEGLGYAHCWDRLVKSSDEHALCFIPYQPPMEFRINMVWKKHQVFSKASLKFLERMREVV